MSTCEHVPYGAQRIEGEDGERDIEEKVLDLPIPLFSSAKSAHRDLAALGATAREKAMVLVREPTFPSSLRGQREFVRSAIKDVLQEIDTIVRTLIGATA